MSQIRIPSLCVLVILGIHRVSLVVGSCRLFSMLHRPTPVSQTSVNLEDMVGDAKTIDEKLKELVSLSNCLGQRNDNSVLRNELYAAFRDSSSPRERAIRDLDGLLSSMDSHLKELEENAKKTATKSELVCANLMLVMGIEGDYEDHHSLPT